MRIRNFGFLANRRRAQLLPLCLQLLQQPDSDKSAAVTASSGTLSNLPLWKCPLCGGIMQVVERLSVAQLFLRSPPPPTACAA
jgi:hypothetical protein